MVDEDYAYALPDAFDDEQAAPLLCAGIIGYRALRRADAAAGRPAGHLRLRRLGPPRRPGGPGRGGRVHVLTRSAEARRLALDLGAASAGEPTTPRPEPLDAAILFAPAGELVPVALAALDRGGTLAVAGIHLSDIPPLDYAAAPLPGAPAAQRHRQHPRRTATSSWPSPPASAAVATIALPAGRGRPGARRPRGRPGDGAAVLVA